ncbi:MAG: hypothetical protein ACI9P5_002989 [Saprospiraceae bacterium]|jgi:hypothetical protein
MVKDSLGVSIQAVSISANPSNRSTITNSDGNFSITLKKGKYDLIFTHVKYKKLTRQIEVLDADLIINLTLKEKLTILEVVNIDGKTNLEKSLSGMNEIDAKGLEDATTGTGEFTKILSTLAGVRSNNELSASYSVRGGNFDENLVYVNGIQIYRPFLVRAGKQEGLSFINSDMVGNIEFSAGGWEAKYGDKLSSVLNISYKKPEKTTARVNASLLGGSLYYGTTKNNTSYSVGVRHKNTRYLLGTLETKGEYLPKFTDVQAYIDKKFNNNKTSLGVLMSLASNRYLTIPTTRTTDFGTFNQSFRLFVAFEGREILKYDTYQTGLKLTHFFSDRLKSELIASVVSTQERENFEIEGGYRLCDLNNNPSSKAFDECVLVRGIGTNYNAGRNRLDGQILGLEQRNTLYVNDVLMEFGMRWDKEKIEDRLKEFEFTDSADFSTIIDTRNNEINLNSDRLSGYLQLSKNSKDSSHSVALGVRSSYWSFNDQWLFSPRIQYLFNPRSNDNTFYRFSAGIYQQAPFYRELRNRTGDIQKDVKAQYSEHYIVGLDHYFQAWGRQFKLSAEMYYKRLRNVNTYDVDNVRIRYFADNTTKAYASGFDIRVNGEFIEGAQSWFSLGILKTKEDIATDQKGYIRRPSDQRLNLGMFFQDYMPNNPSMRVNLNFFFGSGLPFGPPRDDNNRNRFSGDQYYRVDLGFLKIITPKKGKHTIRIGVEILNLLGAQNTISYTWIEDVNSNQFAIPNALSARFANLRLQVKI